MKSLERKREGTINPVPWVSISCCEIPKEEKAGVLMSDKRCLTCPYRDTEATKECLSAPITLFLRKEYIDEIPELGSTEDFICSMCQKMNGEPCS